MGTSSSPTSGLTSLQRIQSSIPGVFELLPKVFRDGRGFFMETFHAARFLEIGITDPFVQENHSCSRKGTLRGLHYQLKYPQAKLCSVVEGEALDVVLDIRQGSPHFGKWTSVLLSAERQNQIYIPPGFAHGFMALTDNVHFLYKCSDYYHPEDEYGVLWNDPQISIAWGVVDPVVSEKDTKLPCLSVIAKELLPRYTKA